ncbi:YitT family protein [Bacillus sp. PK3_68]|uniref:YitT family protein n=1 Tax=Bacillaceae TaxID=186817 RepID=UPI00217D2E20|nr:YitT family protein [Bacillus sp. PK3_68]
MGFAAVLIGIGINGFILPFHLLEGGVFGIGLLFNYLWGFKIGITILCLNFPIYLLAFKLERSYFFNSLYGTLLTPVAIDLLLPLKGTIDLPILMSACVGGLFIGAGTGLMLRYHISPGGVDLLALLLSKHLAVNAGFFIFFMDSLILASGLWIFKDPTMIYSLLTLMAVAFLVTILTSFRSVNIYSK